MVKLAFPTAAHATWRVMHFLIAFGGGVVKENGSGSLICPKGSEQSTQKQTVNAQLLRPVRQATKSQLCLLVFSDCTYSSICELFSGLRFIKHCCFKNACRQAS